MAAEFTLKVQAHPRIHLAAADMPVLRRRAAGTHRAFYDKLIEAVQKAVSMELPDRIGNGDDDRHYGDLLSAAAMAHLLSEDPKYLAFCRRLLEPMLALESWQDGIGLVTGHQLAGVCTMYDWLYEKLSEPERARIREKVTSVANMTCRASREHRAWWHDMFLQNWCHVPTAGLVYAAAALAGEVPDADRWIEHADFIFGLVKEALPEDGNSEEGQGYHGYAWHYILRVFDVLKSVFGKDHFADSSWCRNAPYAVMYSMTPKRLPMDHLMAFGDARRRLWDGPAFHLLKSAAEYGDGTAQDFALRLVDEGIGLGSESAWLSLIWYDPDIRRTDCTSLPLTRLLPALSTVYARSSWEKDAMLVGFKCTSNHTERARKAFPGRDLGVGHAHPDAASFQIYAFGEWLAIDPGYSLWKVTEEHNTVTANGVGQLGGDCQWFEGRKTLAAEPCGITHFESSECFDYVRADASGIYKPEAGLARFIRHLVYLKPYEVLVVDELEARAEAEFMWHINADRDIAIAGAGFVISKNDARLSGAVLLPQDARIAARRRRLAFVAPDPLEEIGSLSVSPPARTARTLVAVFLSAHKSGQQPAHARLESLSGSALAVQTLRDGKPRRITLDLATVKVTVG